MYRLYEKVQKSDEHEFGMKLLDYSENPFKDGPCLVSMITTVWNERNINGALNLGMETMRLKTNQNENTGIGLEDFDGRILSVAYDEPSERVGMNGRGMAYPWGKKNLDEEFTKKYLFPLIEENGIKLDCLQAMKNVRNVNFLTYCNSTESALIMEECLKNRMNELGYSEQEISQIQSQMCIVCYATDKTRNEEYREKIESTCISFGDVNDKDVFANKDEKEVTRENNNTVYLEKGYYFNNGNGNHETKYYILQNTSLSVGISSVLTRALSNSITNSKSNEFIPISRELLTSDIEKIIEEIRKGKSRDELMLLIDKEITYGKDKFNNKESTFSEQEIGKATISTSTMKKDEAQKMLERDKDEIEQIQEFLGGKDRIEQDFLGGKSAIEQEFLGGKDAIEQMQEPLGR